MNDSAPSLIVHIGGAKAGSTSIQDLLYVNRPVLAEGGILAPDTELEMSGTQANQVWFFEKIKQLPNPQQVLVEKLDALCANHVKERRSRPRAIILSAENLSNHKDPASLFAAVMEKYRVQVVLYARRQEDAYQAAWQQWFVKSGLGLDQWLNRTDGFFCDWHTIVSRWEKVAPGNLTIRLFEKELLTDGDVVSDFCSLFLREFSNLRPSKRDMNVSFGVHVSDLYASLGGFFSNIHDTRIDNLLYKHDVKAARKVPNEWIFSKAQIDFIHARHASGNASLKTTYFSDLQRDTLFAPLPADSIFGVSQEVINRRNIAVLAELLFKQMLPKAE